MAGAEMTFVTAAPHFVQVESGGSLIFC